MSHLPGKKTAYIAALEEEVYALRQQLASAAPRCGRCLHYSTRGACDWLKSFPGMANEVPFWMLPIVADATVHPFQGGGCSQFQLREATHAPTV